MCTNKELGLNGFEQPHKTLENKTLDKTGGPNSGPVYQDIELQTVINRWPQLPPLIRSLIIKLATPDNSTPDGINSQGSKVLKKQA